MDPQEFLMRLRFSRLLSEAEIDHVVSSLETDERDRFDLLSRCFVDAGKLNEWQLGQLRSGNDRLVIGKYRLLGRLGEGGMGIVYVAEHVLMKRKAALKTISDRYAGGPELLKRFLREAQVLSQLRHHNIVTTYDLDEDRGTYYMAMELIDGVDLGSRLESTGVFDLELAVDVIKQVAAGLQHAHLVGMVHRDIKPNNVMLTDNKRAILLDMGLAKIRDLGQQSAISSAMTSTKGMMGTPHYMSPEQFVSARDVDIRSDIYSLGCTLYAILTAHHPFEAHDRFQLEKLHREAQPTPLGYVRPETPDSLVQIVEKMMEKDPRDRYQTPEEVRQALEHCSLAQLSVAPSKEEGQSSSQVDTIIKPEFDSAVNSDSPPVQSDGPATTHYHLRDFALEMIKIPGGQFASGCTRPMVDEAVNGLPPSSVSSIKETMLRKQYHEEELATFEISRCLISKEQYSYFLAATGHPWPSEWSSLHVPSSEKDHPVTHVTIDDARAFCEWANLRLPTRTEWEKAARGLDGRVYPWGNEFDARRCNCAESDSTGVVAVDEFAQGDSPFGVRQAVGNVWQWTEDDGDLPMLCGGSYQSTCRLYGALFMGIPADPDVSREHIGFRVVRGDAVRAKPRPARTQLVRSDVVEAIRKDLCVIPAGPFVCGLSEAMVRDVVEDFGLSESSMQTLVGDGVRIITLPSYKIAQRCVTNEQYLAFVRATRYSPPEHWPSRRVSGGDAPSNWARLPVTGVARHDAEAFCNWAGVRLPTNTEWEKAARGDRGALYAWGDRFDSDYCNGAESGRDATMEVDTLPEGRSLYGLYHATGNVFEWTGDDSDDRAVLRGGDYEHTCAVYGLVGFQMRAESDLVSESVGFRVAAD